MSDWSWVALSYSTVYGTLVSYIAWTAWRTKRARRRLEELT